MCNTRRALIIMLITWLLCWVSVSTLKFAKGQGGIGDLCMTSDNVSGVCETPQKCFLSQGVAQRAEQISLCDSGPNGETYVCCRKPYEVAKKLCSAWDRFRKVGGRCNLKIPLIVRLPHELALVGEFPAIGYLQIKRKTYFDNRMKCAVTLLSPHFALTPAHCVLGFEPYYVRFGDRNLIQRESSISQLGKVSNVILHPEYNGTIHNNMALLEFEMPVVLTKRVHPACLPSDDGVEYDEEDLAAVGWSVYLSLTRSTASLVDSAKCSRNLEGNFSGLTFPVVLSRNEFCAKLGGGSPCEYFIDNGLPMFARHKNSTNKYFCAQTVVGIKIFGDDCTKEVVFTRVSPYVDWITTHIGSRIQS